MHYDEPAASQRRSWWAWACSCRRGWATQTCITWSHSCVDTITTITTITLTITTLWTATWRWWSGRGTSRSTHPQTAQPAPGWGPAWVWTARCHNVLLQSIFLCFLNNEENFSRSSRPLRWLRLPIWSGNLCKIVCKNSVGQLQNGGCAVFHSMVPTIHTIHHSLREYSIKYFHVFRADIFLWM